jgi:lipoprotein-releasing system permease protein
MGIFMVQGTVIGMVGTLIGAVLGIVAALNVSQLVGWIERLSGQQILSSDIYFISNLPSELLLTDVLLICGAAFALSFLATLYPSWRAAAIQPADALRYE